jgi:dolichol-phosphate mannosyltransferase
MKKITIVVPVFNESACIALFNQAVRESVEHIKDCKFNFLYVDDGSDDNSFQILSNLISAYSDVNCIRLTRNFGKEAAIFAGIAASKSDAVIVIDCDLQHPPSLIEKMIHEWNMGYLVVSGVRISNDDSTALRRVGSFLFYKIMNLVSDSPLRRGLTDFCLMDKRVVLEIIKFPESNRLFRGILHWMGFNTSFIDFNAPARQGGSSSFYFKNLVNMGINGITSFSLFPLRVIGWFGVVLSTISSILFIAMLIDKFIFKYNHFSPISYVIVVNTFFIGLIGLSMGLIAIYIGNIYNNVRGRPLYIIEDHL